MTSLAANIAVAFVALQHLGFMILESFLWTSETGRRVFHTSAEFALASQVLAANQGLYNGFLAAALLVGMLHPDANAARLITRFALVCIIIAGVVGGLTADPAIVVVQGLPALVALVLTSMPASRRDHSMS